MSDSKSQQVVLAHLASVIERAAADLALERGAGRASRRRSRTARIRSRP